MTDTAAATLSVRNPRTGQPDYELPVHDAAQVAAVARALREAQPAWQDGGLPARLAAIAAFAEAILAGREALVAALTADTGRRRESVMEVDAMAATLRRWINDAPALLADAPPRRSQIPHIRIEERKRPYPVAGVISPWNFPLILSLIDAVPALIAGCAVLVKPSEVTSRFVPVLERVIATVPGLPAVLRFVTGAGATGEAVVRNSDVLCFTGSVRTGRRVGELAAQVFIPCHLELGGKDAAIVCADADIELAVRALTFGSMVNAGQTCMSIERCYVHRSIHDKFAAALAASVGRLRHCHPGLDDGEIGPIIAAIQAPIVQRHLEDAYARGARALTGGRLLHHGGGDWLQPTVLVDATQDMAIVREETFAAVLPVMPFGDEEEAIRLANDTDYGLSGCVFSRDLERARRIAGRLNAGAISINDAALTGMVHDAPKQSFGFSGLGGSRMGKPSLQRFYRMQALLINEGEPSPWWFDR
ncbi:MAG: aldehyde dehydrogenase family protein [Comamonadaceae bacterium]|nr:aldehyde dehydrogenase family protein [Comamonadaceae bacterium]